MARPKTLPVGAAKEAIGRLKLASWHYDATLARERATQEQYQNARRAVEDCRRALHDILWEVVAAKDRRLIPDLIFAIEA
jgi:hypothetical protein